MPSPGVAPELLLATPDALARAASLLRAGKLIGLPTETVYGLAGNALDEHAVAAIFAAKGRPRFNPLIIHVADAEAARTLVEWDERADALARAFWPGPLTLVLARRPGCPVSWLAGAGLATLAVRVPAHPVARELLRECELPLAAPSANRSGRVSPTRAVDVVEEFGPDVELVIDGGDCCVGVESTILDLTGSHPVWLRPGGTTRRELEGLIGPLAEVSADTSDPGRPRAPGQLSSHYAPTAPVRLDVREVQPGEALLAFGPNLVPGAAVCRNLSEAGDLREAAANLFRMLRELDRLAPSAIAVMPIPAQGLGEAIHDRLRRAAAPRRRPC